MPSPTWSGSTATGLRLPGGASHVSPDGGGAARLTSQDGDNWESAALIASPTSDLRDAKITISRTGNCMLSGAGALHDKSKHTHQSLAWFSKMAITGAMAYIGDRTSGSWRVTCHKDTAYGIGLAAARTVRSASTQQRTGEVRHAGRAVIRRGYPNESSLC